MIAYLPLEEKITCINAFCLVNTLKIVIGTSSGEIWLWAVVFPDFDHLSVNETLGEPKILERHDDEITAVAINSSQTKIASCGKDRVKSIVLLSEYKLCVNKIFSMFSSKLS